MDLVRQLFYMIFVSIGVLRSASLIIEVRVSYASCVFFGGVKRSDIPDFSVYALALG